MLDNWVVQNLENALGTWNTKLAEVWNLLTMSPENFKGGGIWKVILSINGAMQAIGLALLVLFFLVGVFKTSASLTDVKRPEHALKLFLRFAIAKGVITYGLELMMAIFQIVQGIVSKIMKTAGIGSETKNTLPKEMINAIEDCGFFESIPLWAVTLIGSLFITILSFVIIMTVYGRFFKLYMYTAIAPIPLSTFAGQPTQSVGISFLKSYAAVCLEGAIIVLACVIFSLFASTPPVVDSDAAATAMAWKYIGELIFNMLVLVGSVKMSDRIVLKLWACKEVKNMMTKNEFMNYEAAKVLDYVPAELRDILSVEPVTVVKMNDQKLNGLRFMMDKNAPCPTHYLDDAYEMYQDGLDPDIIAERTAEIWAEASRNTPVAQTSNEALDFEDKDLVLRVLDTRLNREFLKEIPYVFNSMNNDAINMFERYMRSI